MKRSNLRAHPSGFTLIEIILAMLIGSVVLTGGYIFYTTQVQEYLSQREVIQMQQNLRMAMQYMQRHIRLAGNAMPNNLVWEPLHTGAGEDAAPDTIGIMGSMKSISITAWQERGNRGAPIMVTSVEGFKEGDILLISDGTFAEIFQVTDINPPSQLKHMSSPPYNDDNKLDRAYAEGSTVTMISHVFFYIDYTTDPDHPALVRASPNHPSIQVLGEDIEDMQIKYTMRDGSVVDSTDDILNIHLIELTLTARTENVEEGYVHPVFGDGYRRTSVTLKSIPRSINL